MKYRDASRPSVQYYEVLAKPIDANNGYFLIYFKSEQECKAADKAIEQVY